MFIDLIGILCSKLTVEKNIYCVCCNLYIGALLQLSSEGFTFSIQQLLNGHFRRGKKLLNY